MTQRKERHTTDKEAVIQKFDEEQFGNAMEMFAIIQDEGSFKAN